MFHVLNILDLIESIGEDATCDILSNFSCSRNKGIENFVKNIAIDFAKRKVSITYLVFSEGKDLVAIFTLTHKAIEIEGSELSKTTYKKMERFSKIDETTGYFTVSAFLLAQFARNDNYLNIDCFNGYTLMDFVFDKLISIQHEIGGGIIYLECEDEEGLINFYMSEQNRFIKFGERYSDDEKTKYIRLFRFLK